MKNTAIYKTENIHITLKNIFFPQRLKILIKLSKYFNLQTHEIPFRIAKPKVQQ